MDIVGKCLICGSTAYLDSSSLWLECSNTECLAIKPARHNEEQTKPSWIIQPYKRKVKRKRGKIEILEGL